MDWTMEFDREVQQVLTDLKLLRDEPMRCHTTFRIGGPAKRMAVPHDREQLVRLLQLAEEHHIAVQVIGRGSNLLAADTGLDCLVVNTTELKQIQMDSDSTITAECGVSLAQLAEFAAKQGLTGLEFAHGIPGTLGGAVCMNAGAYGGEMKQVLLGAQVFFPQENERKLLSTEELHLRYRHSLLSERPEAVVLTATVALSFGNEVTIRQTMRDLMGKRKGTQPLEWPSAGSTFKRPEGHFAGTLIDQCGLKGLTVGDAQVSEKHAGFLINRGNATFADMTELIRTVQKRVLDQTGVQLEPEVKIIE